MDLLKWILKYKGGKDQDINIEPYNQVVKVGEGWVDLKPVLLTILLGCQMSKNPTGNVQCLQTLRT
jgi:hypothetical protein